MWHHSRTDDEVDPWCPVRSEARFNFHEHIVARLRTFGATATKIPSRPGALEPRFRKGPPKILSFSEPQARNNCSATIMSPDYCYSWNTTPRSGCLNGRGRFRQLVCGVLIKVFNDPCNGLAPIYETQRASIPVPKRVSPVGLRLVKDYPAGCRPRSTQTVSSNSINL